MPQRPSVTAMPGLGFLELSGPKALEAFWKKFATELFASWVLPSELFLTR